jgi:hypothetical protein
MFINFWLGSGSGCVQITTDQDPRGPKTYGSYGSGSRSGTLLIFVVYFHLILQVGICKSYIKLQCDCTQGKCKTASFRLGFFVPKLHVYKRIAQGENRIYYIIIFGHHWVGVRGS